MALALKVVGLMNVQFAIKDGVIYVLEVNPRASRTVPFVAKATDSAIASIAARLMAGEKLATFPMRAPYPAGVGPDSPLPLADPLIAHTPGELARLQTHRYRPLDPLLTSVHPMGSLPLGDDPRRSVVDPQGRHHQVAGLYVADGSLFPTSIGGPPQLSIYAAGRKIARHLVADLQKGAGGLR
jgi:choline dehydrogenase-like flavoprotein